MNTTQNCNKRRRQHVDHALTRSLPLLVRLLRLRFFIICLITVAWLLLTLADRLLWRRVACAEWGAEDSSRVSIELALHLLMIITTRTRGPVHQCRWLLVGYVVAFG